MKNLTNKEAAAVLALFDSFGISFGEARPAHKAALARAITKLTGAEVVAEPEPQGLSLFIVDTGGGTYVIAAPDADTAKNQAERTPPVKVELIGAAVPGTIPGILFFG